MYSQKMLEYFTKTAWNDLPKEIQHQAKRVFLDNFGAMLAGTQAPVYKIGCNFVADQFGAGPIPLLYNKTKTTASGAALAFGLAGNALDIDDGCRLAKGHPGAQVIPATFVAALTQEKCNGKDFLTALVMGYEAAIRAAYIRHATHDTYHTSGSWGSIGAATAISKLFGLDKETMFHALGTASYHAPIAPMMVGIETPSMGKDCNAWGVFIGMTSVKLAMNGFTGSKPIFDQTPNPEWCTSLGSIFEIMHVFFKPYSACRWAQAGVDGVMNILRDKNLTHQDIAKIRVYTFAEAAALSREYPKDTEYAQYNFSYPIAVAALFGGECGPEHILAPAIHDERLHRMMDKVEVIVEDKYQQMFPAKTVANVEIEDTKGHKYQSGDLSPRWDLSNVLPTDQELETKFKWIVTPVLGEENTQKMVDLIWKLDECDDMKQIFSLCPL